ncbi:unnamed protein product [Dicrocoelium dendriticum]|nr:unnamed protein product [Dicrocoelium dendriticum]
MSVSTDVTSFRTDRRPQSALVQVTEFSTTTTNPKLQHRYGIDDVCDSCLNEETLKTICKTDKLAQVTSLEIKIDARKMTCTDFGALLPNLRQLKLSNSLIPSLKLFGSGLQDLEVLWMPRCSLTCLDGLTNLKNICELYLAFNEISDLSPCAGLESIEVLDLEGNLLSEIKNITLLKTCNRLRSLSLEGNPVVTKLGGIKKYRRFVRKELRQLSMLDDYPVENLNPNRLVDFDVTNLDDDWSYINTLLREIGLSANQSRIGSCKKGKHENNKLMKYCQRGSAGPVCSVRGPRPVCALNRFRTGNNYAGLLSDSNCHLEASVLRKTSSTPSGAESEDSSESEGFVARPTTGRVACDSIDLALRKRFDEARVVKPSSPAPGQEDSAAHDQETIVNPNETLFIEKTKNTQIVTEKSPRADDSEFKESPQLKQVAGAIDATSLLDEEDALQVECAAVLEELASWRRNNVKESNGGIESVSKKPVNVS